MLDKDLYPVIEPHASGRLAVTPPHELYWEEAGRRDGVPVAFLHGGPGAGASADHRRFFDPDCFRAVIFDQRGAGRSRPHGETAGNTTAELIADMEALRRERGIERWLLFGGSWGSTLALAYAQAHPERVLGLVLRGIFLGTEEEIAWFLNGMRRFFPEAWDAFVAPIPEEERGDLLAAYQKRLQHPDPEIHLPAARAWSRYEGACSTLLPSPETVAAFGSDRLALALARIEAHYFANRVFLPEGGLLAGMDRLKGIPGVIVQGRYDVICPPVTAQRLNRAWPESELVIVPDAGHSAMEPGIRRALVAALDRFRKAG